MPCADVNTTDDYPELSHIHDKPRKFWFENSMTAIEATQCDALKSDPIVVPQRFFKGQSAFQGNCLLLAFHNAMGKVILTAQDLFLRVKSCRRHKRVPMPGMGMKLMSFHILVEAANSHGIRLMRLGNMRSPEAKFEFLMSATNGRFLVLTNVAFPHQKRGAHDLNERKTQHWIAVSSDERLVIDSLARNCGPQVLTEQTLRRSIREGIVRIYSITRLSEEH